MSDEIQETEALKEPEKPAEEPAKLQKTTIGECGLRLPIGVLDAGQLHKNFTFGPWRWKQEKRIAKKLSSPTGPGNHFGKKITTVLAEMLTGWGPDKDFQKLRPDARLHLIEQSFMEDVFYAWICLRIHALGRELVIPTECNIVGCKEEWSQLIDLDTVELTVVNDLPDPVPFSLLTPLEWSGKQWSTLRLGLPLWAGVCNVDQTQSLALGAALIELSLSAVRAMVGEDGLEASFTDDLAEELDKPDIERLKLIVNGQDFPHVDTEFEFICKDDHKHTTSFEWGYDFFFGAASLPPA